MVTNTSPHTYLRTCTYIYIYIYIYIYVFEDVRYCNHIEYFKCVDRKHSQMHITVVIPACPLSFSGDIPQAAFHLIQSGSSPFSRTHTNFVQSFRCCFMSVDVQYFAFTSKPAASETFNWFATVSTICFLASLPSSASSSIPAPPSF
ncbi:hypothetical protein, unlikely [Trypanosoma brucei gambiense DAL972]|uniref:Uncharacterized protein n=1 Tax=Trypanosoma brucei gambiense (strain MHOM/CI/86/DAL972) TaxID=679716 RepID=C9ZZW3_TRYB9|nr:hypothetical protein, unlikely [Trypanosoma brucei gambiense DAL972]CBH16521.1 hypothetical protein, unlikely [Trypanosoma brucei gambiense DAL972]|eukprot:XP_011778785.1 hypothetical protein, unlikely [Trypanosoma brucei gambiense DAL972]